MAEMMAKRHLASMAGPRLLAIAILCKRCKRAEGEVRKGEVVCVRARERERERKCVRVWGENKFPVVYSTWRFGGVFLLIWSVLSVPLLPLALVISKSFLQTFFTLISSSFLKISSCSTDGCRRIEKGRECGMSMSLIR